MRRVCSSSLAVPQCRRPARLRCDTADAAEEHFSLPIGHDHHVVARRALGEHPHLLLRFAAHRKSERRARRLLIFSSSTIVAPNLGQPRTMSEIGQILRGRRPWLPSLPDDIARAHQQAWRGPRGMQHIAPPFSRRNFSSLARNINKRNILAFDRVRTSTTRILQPRVHNVMVAAPARASPAPGACDHQPARSRPRGPFGELTRRIVVLERDLRASDADILRLNPRRRQRNDLLH